MKVQVSTAKPSLTSRHTCLARRTLTIRRALSHCSYYSSLRAPLAGASCRDLIPNWHPVRRQRTLCKASEDVEETLSQQRYALKEKPMRSDPSVWERLRLLKRQLDVAVSDENYSVAARLRDELKTLVDGMPAVQQYLYGQTNLLQSDQLIERLQAIKAIVEVGDPVVIPELSVCLKDRELAEIAHEAMWHLFMQHPDPAINDMMVQGVTAMSDPSNYSQALKIFTNMITKEPDFPEAYNKRATLFYMMKKYEESVADCQEVLKRQPYHFGAASGMGLCYMLLGNQKEAIDAFQSALDIHPGMANIAQVLTQLKMRVREEGKGK